MSEAEQHPSYERCEEVAQMLLLKATTRPVIGIITGSGLAGLADLVSEPRVIIPYSEIPEFVPCSGEYEVTGRQQISESNISLPVMGHEGSLVFGNLEGVPVVLMSGRFHPYEGIPVWRCSLPVRIMRLMGVQVLMITNACGAIHPRLQVGDIVLLKDHISLAEMMGESPLKGPNDERWGPRFPSVTNTYPKELRNIVLESARDLGLQNVVSEGVYGYRGGPSYEGVSEVRFMRNFLKADVAGMSTSYEALTGKHCGMQVIGLSLVSDVCIADFDVVSEVDHHTVVAAVEKRVPDLKNLLRLSIPKISRSLQN